MTATNHAQLPTWLLPPGTKRKPFKATKPVPMPRDMPPCFASKRQWGVYKVLAQITATDGFTYCTDCTPERRDKMIAASRCKFPETVFKRNNGVIVGRRAK
mgnify:CR=1 FL=1